MKRGKSLFITSGVGALLALLASIASAGELGVCPPYSKTFGPEDPPEAIAAFINEINLRPGGGALLLAPGDYGDLGEFSVTGHLCIRALSEESDPVLLDARFIVQPNAILTLRSLARRPDETYRTAGFTVTVNPGGMFWSDRCDLRWLKNDGFAWLNAATFSGPWGSFESALRNSGFLSVDQGRVSWGGAWGLINEGGYALIQRVSMVQNGYHDEFDAEGGGVFNTGVLQLVGSTVSGNEGSGGIWNNGGEVEIAGSIVAGNYKWHRYSGYRYPDCTGSMVDLGYNVFGPGGGCQVTDPTSIEADPAFRDWPDILDSPGWDPELAPGSPAIDLIPLDLCPETDALGRPRTDGNGDGIVACDAGALEFTGTAITVKSPPFARDYGLVDLETDTALYMVFMSSAVFDPADVVVDSVILNETGAVPRGYNYVDRNGDSVLDLRLRYRLKDVPLVCGEQSLTVSAVTAEGETVSGLLKLEVIGCTF